MFKVLRIVCSIISALIVASCIFIFIYAGMFWGLVSVMAAAAFFGLTVYFKNLQEAEENKDAKPTVGDFITGPVKVEKTDEDVK